MGQEGVTLPPDRSHVATEQRNATSEALDTLSTEEIVALMARDQRIAVDAVERVAGDIARFADAAARALASGGRLVYAGAGTSGRLGVLDASECPPTFCSKPEQVVGIIAGGLLAFVLSFDEVAVSLFLADAYTQTLPIALVSEMRTNLNLTVAAISTVFALMTVLIVVLLDRTTGLDNVVGKGLYSG